MGWENLEHYKNEILKAEIGALLFNLGKTHIGFWKEKDGKIYFYVDENSFENIFGFKPFESYKCYYTNEKINKTDCSLKGNQKVIPFEKELNEFNLKDFLQLKVRFPFQVDKSNTSNPNELDWIEFFKGYASGEDFIKKIFFRGCENINSGIDKGSPSKQIESPLWLANAFGSFKEEIKEHNFDKARICFFKSLKKFLSRNDYFNNPNWPEIRNFILEKIKKWYSNLLSDSRFPINDVTLFDQAYMTASMFKAVLAQLVLDSSKLQNHLTNPSSIRWRILGIQYDKLGLTDKSLKLSAISWYRESIEEIDDEIKKILEVEYPIGNEIYRDETGIYFIVGESISNLPEEVENEILNIFKTKNLLEEIQPYITLSESSRGLMNLSKLIEDAKQNFLKNKFINHLQLNIDYTKQPIGICPNCRVRPIYLSDKQKNNDPTICEVCNGRIHHQQVEKWIENVNAETIWITEIKDENNRIALVSLKFELQDWLNGNLLNSLLRKKGNSDFRFFLENIVYLNKIVWDLKISLISNEINRELFKNLRKQLGRLLQRDTGILTGLPGFIENIKTEDIFEVSLDKISKDNNNEIIFTLDEENFDKNIKISKIKEKIEKIDNILNNKININELPIESKEVVNKFSDLYRREIKPNLLILIDILERLKKDFDRFYKFYREAIGGIRKNGESLNDFFKQIFFDQIVRTKWETWINSTSLNSKIDWENEKFKWEEFNDENDQDLDFLATLLLQLLLRKNPSPARLRRIWETTKEFFEGLKKNLDELLEIPEWRKKRIVFEIDKNDDIKESGEELQAGNLLFWAEQDNKNNKTRIYLISSIEDFLNAVVKDDKEKEKIEPLLNTDKKKIEGDELQVIKNILNFSFKLKKYNTEQEILTITQDNIKEIHSYKPFDSITDPSPISWQVIIPAETIPKFIDKVMEEYDKNFKFVYGKLPIHIGIITQNYKKPLYVGLLALRRIRRDVKSKDNKTILDILKITKNKGEFENLIKQKLLNNIKNYDLDLANSLENQDLNTIEQEIKNNASLKNLNFEFKNETEEYYSLHWNNSDNKEYNFYIKPDKNWKKWISTIDKFPCNGEVEIIPNTFDFEFLDTNTRRNDIFYSEKEGYKRALKLKSSRPYELETHWGKFKAFKDLISDENFSRSRLFKLVETIYSKVLDSENYDKNYSYLLATSFYRLLELDRDDRKRLIAKIYKLNENSDSRSFINELQKALEKEENLYLFLDMFEFWHTVLKEV